MLVAQWRLTLCNCVDHARLRCPWDFTGKNTGVGCHFPRRGTVPTQGSNRVSCISCTGRRILYHCTTREGGFPCSSAGKESTCNAGALSLIPGLGRAPGEGIAYQYSWTSLVAQLVKSLLSVQETQVQFLGWEVLLEKEMATYSSILACKMPWMEKPGRLQSMGLKRVSCN